MSRHCLTSTSLVSMQIAVLKANGDLDKRFNRRRDDMTRYVEASVQFKMLGKKIGGEAAKSSTR